MSCCSVNKAADNILVLLYLDLQDAWFLTLSWYNQVDGPLFPLPSLLIVSRFLEVKVYSDTSHLGVSLSLNSS